MNLRTSARFRRREMAQALKALFAGHGKRVIKFSVEVREVRTHDFQDPRRSTVRGGTWDAKADLQPVGLVADDDSEPPG